MSKVTRLAQLSDIHVPAPKPLPLKHLLFNKRATGLLNLLTKRKNAHSPVLLQKAVAFLAHEKQSIDHVVVTGDIGNLSLLEEWEAAKALLMPLDGRLSLIPGNHDAYVKKPYKEGLFEACFKDWIPKNPLSETTPYPSLLELNPSHGGPGLVVLGLTSAIPRPPFLATGKVSQAQQEAILALSQMEHFKDPKKAKLALVHHNLHSRGFWDNQLHGMRGKTALLGTLEEARIRLVLHGHTHLPEMHELGPILSVNCGSSTYLDEDKNIGGCLYIYNFREGEKEAELHSIECWCYDPSLGDFRPLEEKILNRPLG